LTQDLRDRLQSHLGGAYTLERELGGGGMSRVFVGVEEALGRRVVVKVLPPELAAGVNLERFRREIQLAAQLQHPHVVPVHAAGMADGLPYFTMPLVDGESLRTRLKRDGQLPVAEVVRILRHVADALAYAHERGIVHRDIKPDNVLMAGSHALVTDFGVAKALSAAKSDGAPGADLTMMGMTMGTPAYMAPEQAAADPSSDHRADIYSLGILGYEMLTGRTPFGGRTPQATLAGHLTETPPPINAARADVPPELEALLLRCLAKRPEDRPQRASDVVHELEAILTPRSGTLATATTAGTHGLPRALAWYTAAVAAVGIIAKSLTEYVGLPRWVLPGALILMALGLPAIALVAYVHHPTVRARPASRRAVAHRWLTWRRVAASGAGVILAFAAVVLAHLVMRSMGIGPSASLLAKGELSGRDPILVAEFDSPSDTLLGTVLSEALRTDLGQSRAVTVVEPEQVREALARMQRPPATRVDAALAREIAVREGIKAVVEGDVRPIGSGFLITTRLVSSGGQQLASFRESARDADALIPAMDNLSKRLREKIGESLKSVHDAKPLDRVTTASLPALRSYTQALQALEVEGDDERGEALLEDAIAKDTNFAMAYRKLGVTLSNAGRNLDRSVAAIQRAFEKRDRLPDVERYMTEGSYYTPRDPDRAIAAYQALLDIQPRNRGALNNLALLYSYRRDYARAEDALARAIAADSSTYTAYLNMVDAKLHVGKDAEARSTLETMARRFPRAPVSVFMRAGLMYLKGDADSAESTMRAHLAANPGNPRVRAEAGSALVNLALTRGQLARAAELRRDVVAANLERGTLGAALDEEVRAAFEEVWFRDDRERALEMVDQALGRHPLDSIPVFERPFGNLTLVWSLAGQPERARRLLPQLENAVEPSMRRVLEPPLHGMRAAIAFGENRLTDALSELRAGDEGPCASCTLPYLGLVYDRSGNADSAIAAYERYVNTRELGRMELDSYFLAHAHKRLGELYDARGDREKAAAHFSRFIELWRNADPELQPRVEDVKRRLQLLRANQG
jgi:tetratricopeptide (TPR) repeat protein/tRNA A-37 threonylcarbamoyl transferase component Bud32